MLYFNTLPRILKTDELGHPVLLTNLMSRARLIESLQNNPMIFYEYAIQEGDTPEIIAHKYYGDPYKYWIILYSNQILDPVWDWPMNDQQLLDYLDNKYMSDAQAADETPLIYISTTVHHYEKITTTTNLSTDESDTKNTVIDETTYDALTPSNNTYQLSNGEYVKVEITKRVVTILDYERTLNENKRQIKILSDELAFRMEEQFKFVMGA
jgi:hypothetical protein